MASTQSNTTQFSGGLQRLSSYAKLSQREPQFQAQQLKGYLDRYNREERGMRRKLLGNTAGISSLEKLYKSKKNFDNIYDSLLQELESRRDDRLTHKHVKKGRERSRGYEKNNTGATNQIYQQIAQEMVKSTPVTRSDLRYRCFAATQLLKNSTAPVYNAAGRVEMREVTNLDKKDLYVTKDGYVFSKNYLFSSIRNNDYNNPVTKQPFTAEQREEIIVLYGQSVMGIDPAEIGMLEKMRSYVRLDVKNSQHPQGRPIFAVPQQSQYLPVVQPVVPGAAAAQPLVAAIAPVPSTVPTPLPQQAAAASATAPAAAQPTFFQYQPSLSPEEKHAAELAALGASYKTVGDFLEMLKEHSPQLTLYDALVILREVRSVNQAHEDAERRQQSLRYAF